MAPDSVSDLLAQSAGLESAGVIDGALTYAGQALALARATNDPVGASQALLRLGNIHYRLGHFDQVREFAQQALECTGGQDVHAGASILLGNLAMETGSLDDAERHYSTAVDLSRQSGNRQNLISGLHDLGACVYALRGQFDLALAAEEEAYRLASQSISPHLPYILIAMYYDYALTGQYQRAGRMIDALTPLVSNDARLQGYLSWARAYLAQMQGDLAVALACYQQARPAAETTGDLGLNIFLRLGLSSLHQATGDLAAASQWAQDAIAWSGRVGVSRFMGRALIERGRSAWLLGDWRAAEDDLRQAIADLARRRQAYDLARAHLLLAALLRQQDRPEAEAAYLEAVTLLVSGGFPHLLERERLLAFPLVAHYLKQRSPTVKALNARLLDRLAQVPPPPLIIFTLGRFEVHCHGQLVAAKAWRRQAGELFRLLLISPNRRLTREQIIENLWPDKPLSAATEFFHQATSSLRRALEPDLPDKFPSRYLVSEEGVLSLCLPHGSWVDYEAFESHLDLGQWQPALELCQGDPFPADRCHDWASSKREQLIQIGLKARLLAAANCLECGDPTQALFHCRAILLEEPWNEQAALSGMCACLELNDRPGAVLLYRDLERCLKEEFDLQPMPELKQLHHSIENS